MPELGPGKPGWWAGVGAFLIGAVGLLVPWPPGVHYSATEADGVNERSGWASCGTPVLGAWTIAVTLSDRGDASRFAWAGFLGLVAVTAVGAAPAVYFATLPVALVCAVLVVLVALSLAL